MRTNTQPETAQWLEERESDQNGRGKNESDLRGEVALL